MHYHAALEIADHRAGAGTHGALHDRPGHRPGAHRPGPRSELPGRPGGEVAAPAQIEQCGAGDQRDDRGRVRRDLQPHSIGGQLVHHRGAGGQAEGTAAGQHDGVDPLHRGGRIEQVGLVGGRSTAADIDPCRHPAVRRQDHRGTGEKPVTDSGVVPDPDAGDVGQTVVPTRFSGLRHRACVTGPAPDGPDGSGPGSRSAAPGTGPAPTGRCRSRARSTGRRPT